MKAWQLIEKEENWCKGASRKEGVYCAIQAIGAAYKDIDERNTAFIKAERSNGVRLFHLGVFNDTHTHAEVVAALKAANV